MTAGETGIWLSTVVSNSQCNFLWLLHSRKKVPNYVVNSVGKVAHFVFLRKNNRRTQFFWPPFPKWSKNGQIRLLDLLEKWFNLWQMFFNNPKNNPRVLWRHIRISPLISKRLFVIFHKLRHFPNRVQNRI